MLRGSGWGLQALGFSCAVSLVALHSLVFGGFCGSQAEGQRLPRELRGSVGAPTGQDRLPEFGGSSLSEREVGPTNLLSRYQQLS